MPEITSEQFAIFKNECERLVERFGLFGWDIGYGLKDADDNIAECSGDVQARTANITIARELEESDGEYEAILDHARHEVLEVLMLRINSLMLSNHISDEEADEARHEVINILNRILKGVI